MKIVCCGTEYSFGAHLTGLYVMRTITGFELTMACSVFQRRKCIEVGLFMYSLRQDFSSAGYCLNKSYGSGYTR